jgi:hypothetical protein
MTDSEENTTVRKAADAAVEYESALEGYIRDRPLAAIGISLFVGALLAKFLF